MKKLLILLFFVPVSAVFAQLGSPQYGGVFYRVTDTVAYQSAAAARHATGYSDAYWNEQATTKHWDFWNGSSYTHVFDFNAGGGGGTQDLQSVLDEGASATITDVSIDMTSDGATDYGQMSVQQNTAYISQSNNANTEGVSVEASIDGIKVTDTRVSRGIQGSADYSANIQANDYTQKVYVDAAIDAVTGTSHNRLSPNIKTASITLSPADTSSMIVLNDPDDPLVITLDDFSGAPSGMQFSFLRYQTDTVYFDAGGETLINPSGSLGIPPNGFAYLYYDGDANQFTLINGPSEGSGGGGGGLINQTLTGDVAVDTDGNSLSFSQNFSGLQVSPDGTGAVGMLAGNPGGTFVGGPDGAQILTDRSGPAPAEGSLFVVGSDGYLDALPAGTDNQVLTSDGTTAGWEDPGDGLTTGTTTITSGTNTRVLFNNSGVLGEYTISGTGNVAMTTSPVFTTPNIGTATGNITGNAATVTTNANLTGDVTSSGNSTTIANNAVTYAKFQQVTNQRILGNVSGGTANVSELTASDLRSLVFSSVSDAFLSTHHTGGGISGGFALEQAGTGASVSFTSVSDPGGHPGIARLSSGTTNAGYAYVITGTNSLLLGNGEVNQNTRMRITQLSTSGERFIYIYGLSDATGGSGQDGVYVSYSDDVASGVFQFVTANNTTRTTTNTDITVAANTWYDLSIVINAAGTSASLYIDGVLKATNTTNIPTSAGRQTQYRHGFVKTVGTTSVTMDTDLESQLIKLQ